MVNQEVYDLAVVGFGPAALAVAVALHDKGLLAAAPDWLRQSGFAAGPPAAAEQPRVVFLEASPHFQWHDGMLLPNAKMQISFVKDLCTVRDPTSKFTFLSWLRSQGETRLLKFTNAGRWEPYRAEFHEYLKWAAAAFAEHVRYGTFVESVARDPHDPRMQNVQCRTGMQVSARKVIICTGGQAQVPRQLADVGPAVVHSARYMGERARIVERANAGAGGAEPKGVFVLGSGQSAAEVFLDLHHAVRPDVPVYLVTHHKVLRAVDDSQFVNELYFEQQRDYWFGMDAVQRRKLIESGRDTNYSVIKGPTLESLYDELYKRDYVPGFASKHGVLTLHEITGAAAAGGSDDGVVLHLKDNMTGQVRSVPACALVCATGYSRAFHKQLLAPQDHDIAGGLADMQVSINYRVKMRDPALENVWVVGLTQNVHGLGESLLSWCGVRGMVLADEIMGGDGRHANGAA